VHDKRNLVLKNGVEFECVDTFCYLDVEFECTDKFWYLGDMISVGGGADLAS